MRKMLLILVVTAVSASLALGTPAGAASPNCISNSDNPTKVWRASFAFCYLVNDRTRGLLGNGYGIEAERDLSKLWSGNLAGTLGYRRFSRDTQGFSNSLNYYTFGGKWRAGRGALANDDGFYYGAGVGIAIFTENVNGISDSSAGVEGLALAGYNFAKSWYGEFSYRSPQDAKNVDTNNITLEVGYRF